MYSQSERILSFKSSSLLYDKSLLLRWMTSLERYYFITHVHNCVMGATPMPSLHICAGSPEPSALDNAISTTISCAGSNGDLIATYADSECAV